MEEQPIAERLRGHRRVPRIVDSEFSSKCREDGHHRRAEPAHDDAILVRARTPALLVLEVDAVVPYEPAVRGESADGGCVERRNQPVRADVRIRFGVDDVEELRVHVRVMLTGVRLGRLHDRIGGPLVEVGGDVLAVQALVRVRALRDPVELSAGLLLAAVQVSEHVVEAAVLEHDDDDMIETGSGPQRQGRELRRIGGRRRGHGCAGGCPYRCTRDTDPRSTEEVTPRRSPRLRAGAHVFG